MLEFDLAQDLFVNPKHGYNRDNVNPIRVAGYPDGIGIPLTLKKKIAEELHQKYFLSGSFSVEDKNFLSKTSLYETRRSKLLVERTYSDTSLFKLIDKMSVRLRKDLKISDYQIEESQDLPASEMWTNSLSALKLCLQGWSLEEYKHDMTHARTFFQQAVEKDSTFAMAYYRFWLNCLRSNEGVLAQELHKSAMKYIYKLPEPFKIYCKSWYYGYRGEPDKKMATSRMWAELYTDDISAHENLAEVYEYRDQFMEAIHAYKRVLQLDAEQYGKLQKIGELYGRLGDYDKSLTFHHRYAEQLPHDYRAYTTLGATYRMVGDYTQAKAYYEKANLLEPENIDVLLALAIIESKSGNFMLADYQYHDALTSSKTPEDRCNVYESLTDYYEMRGQITKVVELLYPFFEEFRNHKDFSQMQSMVYKTFSAHYYAMAAQPEAAFQLLQSIQFEQPFDKFLAFGYLRIFLELEDQNSAEKYIEECEEFEQQFGDLNKTFMLMAKAKMNEMRSEYGQALAHYQAQLEREPSDATIHIGIGRCYRKLKQLKKAKEALEKTVIIEPYHPNALYEIALVYWDQGKKEKALEHLNKALFVWEEADPDYKPAKLAKEKLAEWTM